MTADFIREKHFEDLDLPFVFDRIQVISPYGKDLKKALVPYGKNEAAKLVHRYHLLEQTLERLENKRYEIQEIQGYFKEVKALKHTFERLKSNDTLSVTELYEIKYLAIYMKRIREVLLAIHWGYTVGDFELKCPQPVIELLDPDGNNVNNFHIYSSYSQALYETRLKIESLELEQKKRRLEIIDTLKELGLNVSASGDIRIQKNDVEKCQMANACPHLFYQMDMALYSLYKIKPDEGIERELEHLRNAEEIEEEKVREALSKALKLELPLFEYNTQCIGELDFLIAAAQFCKAFQLIKPTLNDKGIIDLRGARHLKVSVSLNKENKAFVPIDVTLSKNVTLITGANMGGKTVSLRTIGQVVAMAQYGLFVPCTQANLSLLDFIFVSVGDAQSIDMGLSTFGAEIIHIGEALKRTEEKGLILIDELARGTNPKEGFAISKALIDHLKLGQSLSVITTHYDGLTQDQDVAHYQVNGLKDVAFESMKEAISEKGIALLHESMDYRLSEVTHETEIPKEAIRIAEMMGLEPSIVRKAKEILGGDKNE